MRLLNSKSLEMEDFTDWIPSYAILSHTWGEEEVSLLDMQRLDRVTKKGFRKILGCCQQAQQDGLQWVWIDTCCIDKTSSSELSEAINSMYNWYSKSETCYVFLEDVPAPNPDFSKGDFEQARWFKRGWCLQELIAPSRLEFYAKDWSDIGTKWSLCNEIEDITGIPEGLLLDRSLNQYTIAQKMSWASDRETTRREDGAYCLLGIFGVNMPLLYGEGENAFIRLQEEIMRQTEDYTLLLWTHLMLSNGSFYDDSLYDDSYSVLSPSPAFFSKRGPRAVTGQRCDYRDIEPFSEHGEISRTPTHGRPPQLTSRGLHVQMYVGRVPGSQNVSAMAIWSGCMYQDKYVCIATMARYIRGILTYQRTTVSRILLLDQQDFDTFQLSELYLMAKGRMYSLCQGVIECATQPDLEILLSSPRKTTVVFVESSPKILFYTSLGLKVDPPPCAELYCPDIRIREALIEELCAKLPIKFKICRNIGTVTDEFVIVDLVLEAGDPRCSVRVSSETEPMPINCDMDLDDVDEDISDRATCQLPDGSIIYVKAKGSLDPQRLASDMRRRRPASYTLCVELRTREQGST